MDQSQRWSHNLAARYVELPRDDDGAELEGDSLVIRGARYPFTPLARERVAELWARWQGSDEQRAAVMVCTMVEAMGAETGAAAIARAIEGDGRMMESASLLWAVGFIHGQSMRPAAPA